MIFKDEAVAHVKTVLTYKQEINDIRLANETALRIAQEESATKYKELAEQTSSIQKEYSNREKDINATITELNSVNDSLFKQIKSYTTNSNTSRSESVSDSSCSDRLLVIGELLREVKQEEQYYASEAQKLSSSVEALKAWSDSVIENSGRVNYE